MSLPPPFTNVYGPTKLPYPALTSFQLLIVYNQTRLKLNMYSTLLQCVHGRPCQHPHSIKFPQDVLCDAMKKSVSGTLASFHAFNKTQPSNLGLDLSSGAIIGCAKLEKLDSSSKNKKKCQVVLSVWVFPWVHIWKCHNTRQLLHSWDEPYSRFPCWVNILVNMLSLAAC